MKKHLNKVKGRPMVQRDHTGKMLRAIAREVTAEDRKEACACLDISKPTLCKYLWGNGPNSDLALDIFKFLKARIEKRGLLIANLCGHLKSA